MVAHICAAVQPSVPSPCKKDTVFAQRHVWSACGNVPIRGSSAAGLSTPRILNARDEQHAMAQPSALASTAARGPSVSASSFAAKLSSHLHLRKTCILPLKELSCTQLQDSRHQSAGVSTVAVAIDSEQICHHCYTVHLHRNWRVLLQCLHCCSREEHGQPLDAHRQAAHIWGKVARAASQALRQ